VSKVAGRSPERRFNGPESLEVNADLLTPKRDRMVKAFGSQYELAHPVLRTHTGRDEIPGIYRGLL